MLKRLDGQVHGWEEVETDRADGGKGAGVSGRGNLPPVASVG